MSQNSSLTIDSILMGDTIVLTVTKVMDLCCRLALRYTTAAYASPEASQKPCSSGDMILQVLVALYADSQQVWQLLSPLFPGV